MSARPVIKADAAMLAAQPFAAAPPPPRHDPRDDELASLRKEVAALQEALKAAAQAQQSAVAKAREEARIEGLRAAEKDDKARSATLRATGDKALQLWREKLAELDGLAAALAREALEKLLGPAAMEAELVQRALTRHLAMLGREAVLAIHVSADDFDEDEARRLEEAGANAPIRRDSALSAGECRIDLKLGHVDIGPRTQWSLLRAELDALVGDTAGA
ncbi:FliH/SctL family protein [Allosphingosinicella deserti]|uniref:Flagellar assembly protein FliH/Type III secretion system HrpE domain-containing protein n=1 Tax=Allosphingosinicella deserti TaxID=2116704 RepID=A0A2P7QW66_9SPHN|nr:hypothetical protein [Sphingomonas deserti]PSJ42205.1 hypothetical protein C7I55_08205 [Sphingomonas deserti]